MIWIFAIIFLLLPTELVAMPSYPDPPSAPKRIAELLEIAQTDQERYDAILEAAKTLHIGVYTAAGDAIHSGGERGLNDFYVYEFELQAIAASLSVKKWWTIPEMAEELTAMGIKNEHKPVTGADLALLISTGTSKALADPENSFSITPLLVREEGLRQEESYDTSLSDLADSAKFNGFQKFLIFSDIAIGLNKKSRLVQARKRLQDVVYTSTMVSDSFSNASTAPLRQSQGRMGRIQPVGLCAFVGEEAWNGGDWFLTLIPVIEFVGRALKEYLDMEHAMLIGFLIDVQPTTGGGNQWVTHYGPADLDHVASRGTPGKRLQFQIGAQMLAEVKQSDIE